MAGSTTRRYISINPQSRENSEEIHLTNPRNQISGQISIINPATQELENITNIFFSKEDGQQIAESIKEDVKEELKDDYLTIESAESRFISTSQANTFALKSELEGLVSNTELQEIKETIEDEIGKTYVTKTEAQGFAAKSDLSSLATTQSLHELQEEMQEGYVPKSDEGKFILKSRIQEIEQIDTTEPYTLEDVVGRLNELMSALKDSQ